ncbi:restriction endonuclease subunit S [Paenibacillus xylanexedens]|uniref:restriction endonuclease subunit S n=1 Tax=Paenibacillus xylanexedens TaxID=528191 RepID=UPI0011A0F5F6|nr:restriction endonuclease subunit S [Paenibacillus xylanexedens]
MNKKEKITLVPKLRFSEFNKEEAWEKTNISDYLHESKVKGNKGDTAKKLTVKLWGQGVFEKKETLNGSENTQYYRRKSGQFIYSKLDFLNQAFGIIPDHLDGYESTVDLPCFDINENINARFLLEYVQRTSFYKRYGEMADGGRKARRIQVDSFLEFPIYTPNLKEQQKIADCLSSLDDLIHAEGKKLEALKAHKKGLMQKLFPAVGETVPEWRFPEFRGSGKWEISPLSEVCKNLDSRRVPIAEKDRKKGSTPYFGASGIVDYVDGFIFDELLLCVSEDGANLISRTYPIAFSISGKTWVNNHAHVLKFENNYTQVLVESYLNNINLSEFLTGMAQPKLNRAKLDTIPIPLPKEKEQEKITECLSALDTLITEQAEKISNLKSHKKGLVQGLFPSIEEAGE